tara:strand:+ start:340 stop:624 length:285 start_codon:yes stop_codon:yes gene_type:complete
MGRAIDHENSINELMGRVQKLENTVRGMVSKIDEISEKSTKTKHVDLVEEVGTEIEDNEKEKDGKEKTNNEGDDRSSVKSNKRRSKSKKSSDKS